LAPVKRWIELLLAVEAMQAPGRPVLLDIVGGGPMRDEIDTWCRSRNAQWVTCHGVVSDARLVEIYQSATLVVSASSSEGWGMTITEAAACGVPAVVTDVVGHRGAVVDGHTGLLVPTPGDLTATVLALLDDRQRLGHMASTARERASSLSWEAAAATHLDIVRERVADGHR
jgi:glycosyltransferase involved in cell wall biosynthesis